MNANHIIALLRDRRQEFRERYGVTSMALFGSWVHGQQHATSDIDLAIEMDTDKKDLHNFLAFKRDLEQMFGRPVDLGIQSALKPAVRQQIVREMIHV